MRRISRKVIRRRKGVVIDGCDSPVLLYSTSAMPASSHIGVHELLFLALSRRITWSIKANASFKFGLLALSF